VNGPSGPRGIDAKDLTGWSEEPSSRLSDSIDENCWHTNQLDRAAPVVSAVVTRPVRCDNAGARDSTPVRGVSHLTGAQRT
jgi:hypothetical protein